MGRVRYTIGLDEVGRGALAGPVTVGAVLLGPETELAAISGGLPLRDSKKLTPRMREKWARGVRADGRVPFAVASVAAERIDRQNVSRAANTAAGRAVLKLVKKHRLDPKRTRVLLDGGLRLPPMDIRFAAVRTIIKGDEKVPAIALASIMAKVHRDRLMTKRHEKFPQYGFARHKGYGTRAHIRFVKKYGLSPMHRKTFCRFV
ncbi:ribonuclease HII [Patescibacteria group bacterium]|nr:ribonuclease HII [Patescibacteria group bacterium]